LRGRVSGMRYRSAESLGQAQLLTFVPELSGHPVFDQVARVAVGADGQVIAATIPGDPPRSVNLREPRLDAEAAYKLAIRLMRAEPDAVTMMGTPGLVVFPFGSEGRLAWRLYLDAGRAGSFELLLDAADGKLLYRHSLMRYAGSGNVYRTAPDKGPRVSVPFPDSWLAPMINQTNGNNADAYLDTNGDNRPDSLPDPGVRDGRAFSASQVFDFPVPLLEGLSDPRTFRAAAVTNAFYFANVAHDYFYDLGFDERAGNMQRDNGGKGGRGDDPVLVEVQDRFQVNNAAMRVSPDGTSPRMELGLFTRSTAGISDDRDAAYDGQVVIHEYAHAVVARALGAGIRLGCTSGIQSGALDEGWADYFAISHFNDPVQSAYLSPLTLRGIRRQSYEGYTLTFEDIGNDGFQVHRDGEIWAATLWDLRKTLGARVTDRLVFAALRLTPCLPSFVDARDAILAADNALNNNANRAAIYRVFARHGLGFSARGVDGALDSATVFTAATDLPADLQTGNRLPLVTSQPRVVALGDLFSYAIQASDPDGGTLRYDVVQGPPGLTVDGSTGLVRWTADFVTRRCKIAVTDGQGGRVVHGFAIPVLTPLTDGRGLTIKAVRGEVGIASIQIPTGTLVLTTTLRGGQGDADVSLIGAGFPILTEPRSGQAETVSAPLPTPGRWFIVVDADTTFEGVELKASLPIPPVLVNRRNVGVAGEATSENFFRIPIPVGTSELSVATSGGAGDIDLLLSRGVPPVCQSYEFSISPFCLAERGSFRFGNAEAVTVTSPQAGDWFVNITSFEAFSGATLVANWTVRPTLQVSETRAAFTMTEGGTVPAGQKIRVFNTAGGAFNWTATVPAAATWLKLDKTSGAGDTEVTLTIDPKDLAAGSYTAAVPFTAAGLDLSPQTINVTFTLERRPVINAAITPLVFTSAPGQTTPAQRVPFTNSGGGTLEWTATAATTSGGTWLSLDQSRGSGNGVLQVVASPGSLGPGVYEGSVTIAARDAVSVRIPVRYTITIPVTVIQDSLRSVASRRPGAVSPGDMLVIQGTNFTEPCSLDADAARPCPRGTTYPLPTTLGGVEVTVNNQPAPLLLATPTEIRFIVPFSVEGENARVVVTRQGVSTPAVIRQLAVQTPGIFTVLENGVGAGRVFHADGTLVTRAAPAMPEEQLSLLVSGLGLVDAAVPAGGPAPADPKALAVAGVKVYFDGSEATLSTAYLEPGMAGVYRIELKAANLFASKFPSILIEGVGSQSNEATAGGATLLDVSPATAPRGSDANVVLRGINLPEGAAVKIGSEVIAGTLTDGPLQRLEVAIPAALIDQGAELTLTVVNPNDGSEPPSNPVTLRIR